MTPTILRHGKTRRRREGEARRRFVLTFAPSPTNRVRLDMAGVVIQEVIRELGGRVLTVVNADYNHTLRVECIAKRATHWSGRLPRDWTVTEQPS